MDVVILIPNALITPYLFRHFQKKNNLHIIFILDKIKFYMHMYYSVQIYSQTIFVLRIVNA